MAFYFNQFFLLLGNVVELLINFVGIPLSIVNLCLVARTSVIHPNMKAILIFQSFFILLRGCCRIVICLLKFIIWEPISVESMQFFSALAKMYYMGIYSRNFVPHVLIIERIIATLFVRSYEKCRGHLFSILWMPFALAIPAYIAFTTSPESDKQPITNLITTVIQLVIGTIELTIFIKLSRYNSKTYQKMLQSLGPNSLSIRYQLSENIRIGKQLIPPLSLNLGNIFAGTIILLCDLLDFPLNEQIQNFCINLNSFFGLLIELFIITCHPYLKRDFCQIWRNIGTMLGCIHLVNSRRIGDETGTVGMQNNVSSSLSITGIAQRDLISGKAMIDRSNPENHFAMLTQAWERKQIR